MADETITPTNIPPAADVTDNLIITWLDSNLDNSNEDTQNTIIKFQNMINCVKTFTDADQCFNFLHDMKDKKIFLIISDSFNQHFIFFLHLIKEMTQIHSIYIICSHSEKFKQLKQQYKKLKGIFNGIEFSFDTLQQDILQCMSDFTSINVSSIHLDELDPSYIYSKLLIEIILKIQYDEETRKIFSNFCRNLYADNNIMLKTIDQFEQSYKDHSPIWWYTRESLFYSLISKALRTLDIDVIIKMGFFIQDLHQEIEHLHSEAKYTSKMTVYRGQGLSVVDFEKMKGCEGGLLSFNTFLSTSVDRDVSLIFADASRDNPDLVGILFEMDIDPSISSTPFASIDKLNYFADSTSEILLSTHAVFRICTIKQIDDKLWQVNLTLTNNIGSESKYLMDCIRHEIKNENAFHSLARLLNKMGHSDKAIEIHTTLLKTTSTSSNYSNIGFTYLSMGDYSKALSYYEKALENDEKSLPSDHSSLAKTYNDVAAAHQSLGNYSVSLSYYEKALKINQKILPPNHPSLAITYNNIGDIYNSMGEYSKALSFYEQTLEIQQKSLPYNHPSLAITHNNIGLVHRSLGNYSIALLSYKKTLEIEQHSLLPNHSSLSITYNNIGLLYGFIKDYSNALSYYKKALEIAENFLPSNHSSLALIYNNIGQIHDSMDDHSLALSYYEKALKIQETYLPLNHPELAVVYNNIGEVHRSTGNYSTALTYYEKTLEIEQKIFSSNHPSLAITYTNMAVTYEDLQQYTEAIKYTEQAIDILQHVFGCNHSKTKETQIYLKKLQEKL